MRGDQIGQTYANNSLVLETLRSENHDARKLIFIALDVFLEARVGN